MTKPTPDQLTRLPKWAQEYIETLERAVEDSQRVITELQQDEPTEIYWTTGIRDEKKYIPNNARIYIERGGEKHALLVHWDRQRDMLNVAAEFNNLIVHPHSSNWIHVKSE